MASVGISAVERGARLWPFGGQAARAPARPVYAIGDVNGCHGALIDLLALIDADIERRCLDDAVILSLGGMIDRGPDPARAAAALMALQALVPEGVVCLAGAAERALLAALDDPAQSMRRWIAAGGAATLRSFGVDGAEERSATDIAAALRAALPAGMEDWIRGLPLIWRSGALVAVHAGLDPARPPEGQATAPLRGHPRFGLRPRPDGLMVVHGGRILPEGRALRGHVGCATGAFAGGPLTAAHIGTDGAVSFLAAHPGGRR